MAGGSDLQLQGEAGNGKLGLVHINYTYDAQGQRATSRVCITDGGTSPPGE